MTNQQKLNAMWTAMATIASMTPSNEVEFEVVNDVQEFFMNPMYVSTQKAGFNKNFFAVDKLGKPFATRKGENMLFGEAVITINKMQPKPVEKMTDNEVIETFINTGNQICQRIPNGVVMQKKVYTNYNKIYDAASCVVDNINNFVSNLPAVEETV